MFNAATLVKTITNAQMNWLVNSKKVWTDTEGEVFYSSKFCYLFIPGDMSNPAGHWEVHN